MTTSEWTSRLCGTVFFAPCRLHGDDPKNECTFFCLDAPKAPALCAHCLPLVHPAKRLLQVRRYMYQDVVKQSDISRHLDVAGVQTYTVNGHGVVFLLPKAGAGAAHAMSACRHCRKALRPGAAFCSVACKAFACGESINKRDPRSLRTRPRKQARPVRAD